MTDITDMTGREAAKFVLLSLEIVKNLESICDQMEEDIKNLRAKIETTKNTMVKVFDD